MKMKMCTYRILSEFSLDLMFYGTSEIPTVRYDGNFIKKRDLAKASVVCDLLPTFKQFVIYPSIYKFQHFEHVDILNCGGMIPQDNALPFIQVSPICCRFFIGVFYCFFFFLFV